MPSTAAVASSTGGSYDFEDGTVQGWSVDYGPASAWNSTQVAYSGTHSLAIDLTGAGNPGITSPTGSSISPTTPVTYHIFLPSHLKGLSVVPYSSDTSYNYVFSSTATLSGGRWNTVTFTPGGSNVSYVGLEIENGGGSKGALYLDDVTWTPATPSTSSTTTTSTTTTTTSTTLAPTTTTTSTTLVPTTTSTPGGSYDFEDGTIQGWSVDYGPANVVNSTQVAYSGTHSLAIGLTGAGNPGIKSPTGSSISPTTPVTYHIFVPSGLGSVAATPYASDASYNYLFAASTTLSAGQWNTVSFTPGGSNVSYVGVEVENGGGMQGSVYLDDVTWTSGSTPSTSTTTSTSTTQAPSTTTTSTTTVPVTSTPQPSGGPAGPWNMVFDSEFSGTALNSSQWSTGWFGSGITQPVNSSEQECYDPAQVSIDNGLSLNAVARSESCGGVTRPYASGMITTNSTFQFTYGFMEARLWLPANAGAISDWPAFWADGQNWPADGEIDVVEGLGGQACAHFHNTAGGPGACVPGGSYAGGWHTFAADWEPGSLTFYYDGVPIWQDTSGITSAPMYLILDLALDSSITSPDVALESVQAQYVRVWQH